jgi:hypothetical protein
MIFLEVNRTDMIFNKKVVIQEREKMRMIALFLDLALRGG